MIRELKTLNDPLWPALAALYESSFDRASREPLSRLEEELRGDYRLPFRFLVEEMEDELQGFARWCSLGETGFLIHLAVDPTVQGRGIGKGLINAILREQPRLLLEADAEDDRLTRFYGGFGAKILTSTYTQLALHADTRPVEYALTGIGDFDDPVKTIREFYRQVWQLPAGHPYVVRAVEGVG